MPFIIPANTLASGGFAVDNSCRFNSGSSDSLEKTFGSASNRKTYTLSCWVKRSSLGSHQRFYGWKSGGGGYGLIWEGSDDDLRVYLGGSAEFLTNRKFRDISAWYHIVLKIDTTQSTEANRMRVYINGVEETSFSARTYPSQNEDTAINIAEKCRIGVSPPNDNSYLNGYMSEVCFIDGVAHAPTDFGEFDEDSGIWKPIDVSGLTFGTNGFYLDFENSGALGADVSGNSNNFTVNNLTATDQSTDTCTNNFCTINPLVNGTQRNPTLSEGNTFLTNTSGAWKNCLSSFAASSGKWYFEIKPTLHGTSYVHAGIFPVDDWQNQVSGYPNFGGTANSWSYDSDGNIVNNDGNANTSPATYTTNNIIGIAVDLDNNKFYAYKNNALQVAGGTSINANIEYYFGGMGYNSNIAFNFGNPSYANSSSAADGNGYGAFEYAPPSGFFSINTKNLAEYG